MEEEHVDPQDGGKTTVSVEEEDPEMAGPPLGRVFDPVPAPFDDRHVVFGLPAFFDPPEEDSVIIPAGDEEEELADVVHDEEDVEGYDMDDGGGSSDSEMEGNDDEPVRFWDGEAAGSNNDLVTRELTFLGQPALFASYQGTAGFMRVAALEAAPPAPGEEAGGGVIAVHYRYYRFSRPRGRGHGVDAPNYGTDLHHVRYVVPFAADPASSLRLVGASLAADVYPYRSNAQLQALWSGMVAAAPVRVPPLANELVITVDVGVLRSEDRTPEHMECMRSVLEEKAREVDASPPTDYGQEQLLPAPVRCDDGEPGGAVARPAKRGRFDDVAGEEVCAICQEVLEERGLAAWPRCAHVFHGKCLEQLLATVRHRCPMCRRTLSIKGMFD
ncbi:hypothetical protein SETIT_8G137900v2 [Setaria italica]|uniref:RING-type E3 ubiquitin transferase n=1 Tax=Setaria italica TaxID=4555 RepID=K3ZM70_SETIT|nr:hypothetical protein SETIT_8G137900v2 [Setaria italica]